MILVDLQVVTLNSLILLWIGKEDKYMCEDLEQRCEGCHYCEYTEADIICRYNGNHCPTDGTCYKDIDTSK